MSAPFLLQSAHFAQKKTIQKISSLREYCNINYKTSNIFFSTKPQMVLH